MSVVLCLFVRAVVSASVVVFVFGSVLFGFVVVVCVGVVW